MSARTPADLSWWYCEDESASRSFATARTAFEEGLTVFRQKLTHDSKKRQLVDQLQASTIHDVLDAVKAAQTRYQNKRTGSKTYKCLVAFSKRVRYYGNIMDVMVQHHPEYVSLAWGAMKLLFGAVIEHENACATMITALCDIADSLPRVELATTLYPTNNMRQAVALLYAHIVRFLIRTLKWYEEGRLAHALHSVTRPASLRYDDLIREIKRETQSVTDHAIASSQAEQRDMHEEIRTIKGLVNIVSVENRNERRDVHNKLCALTTMVAELRESLILDQSINWSAQIPVRSQLKETQLDRALSLASSRCNIDHESDYRASLALRNRCAYTCRSNRAWFWISLKLHDWNSLPRSSMAVLNTSFKERLEVRNFCTNVIEQLVNTEVGVLWVLRDRDQKYSLKEVLKSLILQALSQYKNIHTDIAFLSQAQMILDVQHDQDYMNILGSVIQHFRLIYIITDTEALATHEAALCQVYLHQLSQMLAERGVQTIIKIIVTIYGPNQILASESVENIVLRIRKTSLQSRRKATKEHVRQNRDLLTISARTKRPSRRNQSGLLANTA